MTDSEASSEPIRRLRQQAEQIAGQAAAPVAADPVLSAPASTEQLLHELRVRQIELEMQNEELRRAQAALEMSRARYFELYDLAPVAYLTVGERGLVREANLAAAALLGVARGTLVGMAFPPFIHREDQDIYYRPRRDLPETGTPQACELRLTRANVPAFWAHLEMTAAREADGALVYRVMLSDNPERQRSAEAFGLVSERLALAVRAGGVGIWDYDVLNDRLVWDDQMFRLYGIRREQFSGAYEAWQRGLHPDDRQRGDAEIQQALQGKKDFDVQFRVRWPDGTTRHIRGFASVQRDARGQAVRMVGTNWDITAQVRAEEALRESEANFRTFFETITDMIMAATPDGRLLYCNAAVTRLLGYTTEELRGMPLLDLHPADRRGEAAEIFAAMFRGERESCPLPLVTCGGALVPVETRVWFGKWNGADCLFGVCKDLSSEQEAKQRLERLFRNNPTLMALSTLPDRRFADVNEAFLKALGYTRDEVIGKSAAELALFVCPDEQAAAADELQAVGRVADLEMQVRRRDGAILEGLFSGEVISSQGRQYFLTVMVDISAHKRADADLVRERGRLAGIIQGTHVGTWEWNVQTGETVFNERWADIVGYTLAELAPVSIATWLRLAHPDDLQQSGALLEQHFRGDLDYYEYESRMRHKDGTWVWVLDRGKVASWAADGKPLWMLGTHQDISARKRVEMELARVSVIQRELMRLATKFINVPLERQDVAIDQSLATMGELIQADRAYLFEYDFDAGVMRNTHEWCGPNITPEIGNLQAVPTSLFPEWVAAHRRGDPVHVPSVAALAVDDPLRQALEPQGICSLITLPLVGDEACTGFVGFDAVREERLWRDDEVSLLRVLARLYAHFEARRAADRENRELQKGLALARDAAQEAARAKSLFLANMSHEIRTPLNAILGYAQIMERDCRACPTGHRLHAISRSGEHLLQLINDLLELVRSETNVIPLSPTDFDFPQVLEDVRLMFAQQPAAQEVELAVSCAADVPRFIHADQGRIRQVLVNLVGNALKFTEKGSVRLTATVPAERPAGEFMLAVDVEDTGSGIAADELPRVFDIFYLAEGGRKTGKGTGLGLPLSRRYARSMGGDVTASSRLGEGSCFHFTFQVRPAKGAVVERVRQRSVQRLVPGQPPWRVLAVDDDPMSRTMLIGMLRPVGFAVETVVSAAEAWQRLGQTPKIDLVLLDKNMPGMDGYVLLGHLRELPAGRDLPVLVVTASGFADERERAVAAGANGFVAKPVSRKTLLAEIARVTGVRYEDDVMPTAAAVASAPSVLSAEALTRLPGELRDGLEQALRRGDIRQLRQLVDEIGRRDAGLALGVRVLVDAYEYERLRRLLDAAKGKAL
jgi:PAS domain S-box-containing protein